MALVGNAGVAAFALAAWATLAFDIVVNVESVGGIGVGSVGIGGVSNFGSVRSIGVGSAGVGIALKRRH